MSESATTSSVVVKCSVTTTFPSKLKNKKRVYSCVGLSLPALCRQWLAWYEVPAQCDQEPEACDDAQRAYRANLIDHATTDETTHEKGGDGHYLVVTGRRIAESEEIIIAHEIDPGCC